METYLASVLDGEISSFEPVVNEHQRECWGVLGVLLLDRERTGELAKEVFLGVYSQLGRYDAKYPFRAFVRTIARQRVREVLAEQAVGSGGQLPVYRAYVTKVFGDDAGAAAHMHKVNAVLEKQAGELPGFVGQLLYRRYERGQGYEEIAKEEGKPVAAVRQTIRRAMCDLADRLIHRKREDESGTRSVGEELTLKLIDGSMEEAERGELERLLMSEPGEVPGHIALMEVEAWLRGRWQDAKLGRTVINAIGKALNEKRAAAKRAETPAGQLEEAAASVSESASRSKYRRRKRKSGPPVGLIALFIAAVALVGVGWVVYTKQKEKLEVPAGSLMIVGFDGEVGLRYEGSKWQVKVNLPVNPPASVSTGKGGKMTVQYSEKLRMTLGEETEVGFETNASVARLVKVERGMLKVERMEGAGGPAPLIIAGNAEVVAAAEGTGLQIQQVEGGYRIDVARGQAMVSNRGTGENVQLNGGQFAVVSEGLALRAHSGAITRRVSEGLVTLYRFAEGRGDTVHDGSGNGNAMDLKVSDAGTVRWGRMSMRVIEPTMIRSEGAGTKVIDAIKGTGELTVEAWVEVGKVEQGGPIIALEADTKYRNFALFQGDGKGGSGDQFGFVLRRRVADGQDSGQVVMSGANTVKMGLMQVVVTHEKEGRTRWYINGKQVGEADQPGDFGNWGGDHALVLGNETVGDRPWMGAYRLVAIYDRALSGQEVAANYDVGLTEPVKTAASASDGAGAGTGDGTKVGSRNAVRTGYQEAFYLAGTGPTRTDPVTLKVDEYRYRIKITAPGGTTDEVELRQRDRNSDRGEVVFTTTKSGFTTMRGTMGKGEYVLFLTCNTDVEWVISIEELRELEQGQAATPDRPEFKE